MVNYTKQHTKQITDYLGFTRLSDPFGENKQSKPFSPPPQQQPRSLFQG